MDTREHPQGSPASSFTSGRAWPASLPRRPSAWLLLLAIPFWFTVWCLNLPTAAPPRCTLIAAPRAPVEPPRITPPAPSLGHYRLADYPGHRCSRLVLSSSFGYGPGHPSDPIHLF